MPVMDVLETTAVIRDPDSDVLDHDVFMVSMTAHPSEKDRQKCIEVRMNDYFSKFFEPDKLFAMIDKLPDAGKISEQFWQYEGEFDSDVNFEGPDDSMVLGDNFAEPGDESLTCAGDKNDLTAMYAWIETDFLMDSIEGSREFAGHLIDIFLDDYKLKMNALEQVLKAEDSEGLKSAAHALKGMLAHFTPKGADIAFKLETIGRRGSFKSEDGDVEEIFNQLKKAIQHILYELKHFQESLR